MGMSNRAFAAAAVYLYSTVKLCALALAGAIPGPAGVPVLFRWSTDSETRLYQIPPYNPGTNVFYAVGGHVGPA
eukprot:3724728-Rhodomonas_salina.2